MQVKIQNQNILITGATGGIGKSIVKTEGENFIIFSLSTWELSKKAKLSKIFMDPNLILAEASLKRY